MKRHILGFFGCTPARLGRFEAEPDEERTTAGLERVEAAADEKQAVCEGGNEAATAERLRLPVSFDVDRV